MIGPAAVSQLSETTRQNSFEQVVLHLLVMYKLLGTIILSDTFIHALIMLNDMFLHSKLTV